MFRNYLKIAWRSLLKNRFHSALNIFGMAIGLGFTFLVAAYVWKEAGVNRGLRHVNNQYILQSNWKDPGMGLTLTTVGPLAKYLKEQYPNLVSNYYRWDGVTSNVSRGDKVFREGLQIGDSTLLNMYGFELSDGDARTALNEPFSMVISEQRALKYFGRTNVAGERLTIESFSGSRHEFTITGVMKEPARNSVLQVNTVNDNQFFVSYASLSFFGRDLEAWNNPYIVGLVELKEGVDPKALEKPMQALLDKNAPSQIAANMRPYLAPLKNYYLKTNNRLVEKMLYTVSFIALFILLMAIINFVNVSIGKASTRIREIGVRKVMGGQKHALISQFLVESILTVFLSALLSLLIYQLGRPFLAEVLGNPIPALTEFPPVFALAPLALSLVVGTLAGIYPAFVLSALSAVDAVKGKLKSVQANIALRKTLVGFQFCTAAVVLAGALIASEQISLFFSKNLGYDKEFVVSAQVPRNWTSAGVTHMAMVRNEFARLPQVSAVSLTYGAPDGSSSGFVPMYSEGKDSTQAVSLEQLSTDEHYLETLHIPLAAGRFFAGASDSLNLVINETAANALGWKNPGEAIGKKLFFPGNFAVNIIGVTKDFHFNTMKNGIAPLMFSHIYLTKIYRQLSFKLKPGNTVAAMEALRAKWSQLLPGSAFQYRFMDDALAQLYSSEIQLKKASYLATLLCLVIVMLGVVGLVSLSIQKRIKEIGIRKVLGASVPNIASLFLKDFLPVILAGALVAVPVCWYLMQHWLNDYAYRISIGPQPFLIALAVLGLATGLLIALQTARTAMESPVKNLRTE